MTALAIADLHLSAKTRDEYRFAVMKQIAELIEKHKVAELLILGDLTEEKDFHAATLVNDVVEIIFSLSQFCKVYILRGNHDYTSADCPFFHFLRRLKHVRWINKVTRLDLSIGHCLFLPHTREWEKDWALFPHLAEVDWVFAHNTFEGAETEHGKKLSGIPTDIFDETRVISGDIHTPQTLGSVTYVGSPYTVDFGDAFEPRALLIERDGFTSIALPGPQKRLIEASAAAGLPTWVAKPGDIVKVRYTLLPDEQDRWHEIKARIRSECEEAGFTIHLIQPVTTTKKRSVLIQRAEAKSDERLVREFGRQSKVSKGTLEAGVGFLKEA
jgi:predicted phosphodiesterase